MVAPRVSYYEIYPYILKIKVNYRLSGGAGLAPVHPHIKKFVITQAVRIQEPKFRII
jgi:hypothetical protein